MSTQEISQMMQELQQHRQRDRDYQSLEDQIRCLQKRFDALDDGSKEEELKEELRETSDQIDRLKRTLEQLRQQIKEKKTDNRELKEEYIHLHHVEGEKNAELAELRGDTSKQMSSNNEFEGEIQGFRVENHRLKEEKANRKDLRKKVEKQCDAYMKEAQKCFDELQVVEREAENYEHEIQESESFIDRAVRGIQKNKEAVRGLQNRLQGELQPQIEEKKDSIHKLRSQIKDNDKQVSVLKQEVSERQVERTTVVEKENRHLKQEVKEKEREGKVAKKELENERERERISMQMRQELEERMQLLNKQSETLEKNQKAMEHQLEDFVEENEKIRHTLYQRDQEAERKFQYNQQVLFRSSYNLEQSQSPKSAR